ncbi:SDR family oxidoreductase [soil metagenome]
MSSIVVTGATGHLGGLTVEALLARGVDPATITATGRNPERLAALGELGVRTAVADLGDPTSLEEAFAGADKVLLVSGSDVGQRVAQHRNAIDAAKEAGVALLAYTSAPYATTTTLLLAAEHKATEELLAASGVAHVVLRNSWYVENYTDQLDTTLEHGVVLGSAGDGRVSGAPRVDFAEAAAAVLATDGHEGKVYELGGDPAFTLTELAAVIAEATGRPVTYQDVPPAAHLEVLLGAGLPAPFAEILVDADRAIAAGELATDSGDLARLIGRPTTPLAEAVAAAVAARP